MSKCTKCNKELASDHRGKKCDNCKNRIFERIRKTGEVIGVAALVVIAVASRLIAVASRPAEDEERDDEDDF